MAAEPSKSKLGAFLIEVAAWDWETFCRAENDSKYSSNEAVIFALVRACVMEKMDAIKLALNRLDGKLKTPIKIELPKVYYLYPRAKTVEVDMGDDSQPMLIDAPEDKTMVSTKEPEHKNSSEEPENDLPSLSLRQTLTKMSDYPRDVPKAVIQYAEQTQLWLNDNGPEPIEKPMVKSVVAAHLLKLAQNRNVDALGEVFDQIDGKLVETIQLLGDDIYITDYSLTAPDGAYLNKDGVLQLEASQAQDMWAQKLGK